MVHTIFGVICGNNLCREFGLITEEALQTFHILFIACFLSLNKQLKGSEQIVIG